MPDVRMAPVSFYNVTRQPLERILLSRGGADDDKPRGGSTPELDVLGFHQGQSPVASNLTDRLR